MMQCRKVSSDFWLIWFFNQRAKYNHALSIVHRRHWHQCWHHWHWCHLCTPLLAKGLKKQTSYLVLVYTLMTLIYAHQIFTDSDL